MNSRHIAFTCLALWGTTTLVLGQNDSPNPHFEVTSVKRSKAEDSAIGGRGRRVSSGILEWRNITLEMVIESAYSLNRFQIRGTPSWLETERYDISAKAPAGKHSDAAFSFMIQKLLEERFGLIASLTTAEFPMLRLVRSGTKLKMTQSTEDLMGCGMATAGRIDCNQYGATMPMLCKQLQVMSGLDMPVRDFMDLPGIFRFNLVWAPDDQKEEANSRPSLQTALREQLGLKLEKGTRAMPVLVIKKINRDPIEN